MTQKKLKIHLFITLSSDSDSFKIEIDDTDHLPTLIEQLEHKVQEWCREQGHSYSECNWDYKYLD